MGTGKKHIWDYIEQVSEAVLRKMFGLFGKSLSDHMLAEMIRFIKFGIIGVSNTAVSYTIYVASLFFLRRLGPSTEMDLFLAQLNAFVWSVLWSFYWNSRIVFQRKEENRRSFWKSLLKTYVSYSFSGLLLSSILLYFCVHILHISEFLAPLLGLAVTVPVNYLMNKFWAFAS